MSASCEFRFTDLRKKALVEKFKKTHKVRDYFNFLIHKRN